MLTEHVVYLVASSPTRWATQKPPEFEGVYSVYLPLWLPVEDWLWNAPRWETAWRVISQESPEQAQRNVYTLLDWGMESQVLAWASLNTQPSLPTMVQNLVFQFSAWVNGSPRTSLKDLPWTPRQWHIVKQVNSKDPLDLRPGVRYWETEPNLKDISEFYK